VNPALANRWTCSWTLNEIDEYLNPPPIFVDAGLPATLDYQGGKDRCFTTQEAVLAFHKLPIGVRPTAIIRVKGGSRYGAAEIARLHYGPKAHQT
jgi:hypothetical protein